MKNWLSYILMTFVFGVMLVQAAPFKTKAIMNPHTGKMDMVLDGAQIYATISSASNPTAADVPYDSYSSNQAWQNVQDAIVGTNRMIPQTCVNVFDGTPGQRGFTGFSGAKGRDGTTYTMTVGTVTDLPPGSTPFINYSSIGETTIAVNYGLVQGAQGEAANVTEASVISAFAADTSNNYLRLKATSGTPEKLRVYDANNNIRLEITSTGLIVVKDASGVARWGFDTTTNSMSMRRGTKTIFSVNSTGQVVIGG